MEELFNAVAELFLNGEVKSKFENVKIEEDADGNIVARFVKPQKSKEIEAIKAELEEMDDDIFAEAAKTLHTAHPEVYKVLETLDDKNPDVAAVRRAYGIFKQVVAEIVEKKIKALTAEVNRLFSKYLDKKVKA
jgi:archaellum component FlaC